jgi:ribose 5-phosphate isomerase B
MKVYIGADHAGYELKEKLKVYLQERASSKEFLDKIDFWTEPEGFTQLDIEDKGAFTLNPNDDYPDFIVPVAKTVANEKNSIGIILGGSGQGEGMSANKFNNARCVVFYGPLQSKHAIDITGTESDDPYAIIRLAREHNNANILSIGSRFVTLEEAQNAVELFLTTQFSNDPRHIRRINKL